MSEVIELVKRMPDGTTRKAPRKGEPKWVKVYGEGPRNGEPKACIENTRVLLDHYGAIVRVNLMTHKAEIVVDGSDAVSERKEAVGEARIRDLARKHRLPTGRILEDHITQILVERAYHPVAEFINSRPWDGVSRIGDLFASLELEPEFKKEHGARALRMFRSWLGMAARAALVPGDAAEGIAGQTVLVLQGPQGKRKTRWIRSLVPHPTWVKEGHRLDPNDRDNVMQATETWITELGELEATFRKSDLAALKAFVTSRSDTYRRAYERASATVPRRTVFAASVNAPGVLGDDTGNRRFLFFAVLGCNPDHGVDLQQLWAEAACIEDAELWATEEDQAGNEKANQDFELDDPIADACARCWEIDEQRVSWEDLDAIKRHIDRDRVWTSADARHLSAVLRNRMKVPSRKVKGYRQYAVVHRV